MPDKKISRRTFLKVTTVAGTGMLVGCSFQSNPLVSSPDVKSEELGLFVRISKDNNITIISPTSEIGQGTHTAHAMIIAEELDAEWEKIKVVTTNKIRSEYYTSSSVSTGGNRGIGKGLLLNLCQNHNVFFSVNFRIDGVLGFWG